MTPGKLVRGHCYYPNHGDEHQDSSYHYLKPNTYFWKTASNMNNGDRAVSTGEWDAGGYVYHCRTNPTYSQWIGEFPKSTRVGKYVPGTGTCYFGWYGDETKVTEPFLFEILIPTGNSSPSNSPIPGSGGGNCPRCQIN